jgi:tetratricopeptide (TPR) repeat protein
VIARILLPACLALAGNAPQTLPEKLIEEGHWKKARTIVDSWIREKLKDPLANFLLSQVRGAFHDRQSPLELAETAVRLDGSVAKYHRQLAEVIGVTAQHASMLQQLFLARRFKKEIDTALAEDATDLQAMRDLMEYYLLAPGIAGGDRDKAQAVADRIERQSIPEGCMAKARLAEFDKQPGKVEGLLRRGAGAQPPNYRARAALAAFYLAPAHRNYDLAEQSAREALRIGPGRVEGYAVLATALASRANWSELEALLARAEGAVPDDLTPDYRAAEAILASGRDLPRAEALLRKYLAAEPEGNAPTLADAHWQFGLVLEKQGRRKEAVAEWNSAARLDPDSPAKREIKRMRP